VTEERRVIAMRMPQQETKRSLSRPGRRKTNEVVEKVRREFESAVEGVR